MKKIVYLLVFICFGWCHAGSYDEFFTAIRRDDARAVSNLLERGFDPDGRDPQGRPGLLLAIAESALRVAEVLIAWPRSNVDIRNAHDETALMLASLHGHLNLVRQLIERGAQVNKPGWTPLHYASTHGHLEVMRLLLDRHAYIDAESPNGTTPLMMAAHYGTPAAVKLLLEAGADPMLRNSLGLSAIDFAHGANRKESAELIAQFIRARQPSGRW